MPLVSTHARTPVVFPLLPPQYQEESMEVGAETTPSCIGGPETKPGSKYLEDLERRHLALSSVIDKLDSQASDKHEGASSSKRQLQILQRTLSALRDTDGDTSDGKWVFLSHILHMACTGGGGGYGYRWSGARPDLAPPMDLFDPVPAVPSNVTAVPSPRKSTTGKPVGIEDGKRWLNASTPAQWQEFEKRFFEERRVTKKVEQWKKGLVVCGTQSLLADDSKNGETFEESAPVTVDEVLQRAAAASRKGKEKEKRTPAPKNKPATISLARSSQDLLKDASPFGFGVVKKQRTMSATGKPKPKGGVPKVDGAAPTPVPALNRSMNPGREKGKGKDFLDLDLDGSFHFRSSQLVTSTPKPKPNAKPISNDKITVMPPLNTSTSNDANSNVRHPIPNPDANPNSKFAKPISTTNNPLDKSVSLPIIGTTTLTNTNGKKGLNKRPHSPSQQPSHDHNDLHDDGLDTIERALKKARTIPPRAPSSTSMPNQAELNAYLNLYYANSLLDDGAAERRKMEEDIAAGKLVVMSPPVHKHRTLVGYAASLASAQAARAAAIAASASKNTSAAAGGIAVSKEDKGKDKAAPSSPPSSPPASSLIQQPMFSSPTKPRRDIKMQPMTSAIPKLTDLLASARKTKTGKDKGQGSGKLALGSSPVSAFRDHINVKGKGKGRADTPMEEIVNADDDVFSDHNNARRSATSASAAEVAGFVLPTVDADMSLDMTNFKPLATSTQHGPLGVNYESQSAGVDVPFVSGSMDAPPLPFVNDSQLGQATENAVPPETSQASVRTTASKDSWASVYAPVASSSFTAAAGGPAPQVAGSIKSKWAAPSSSNFMAPSSSLGGSSQPIPTPQQQDELPTSGYPYSPAYQYNSQLNKTVARNVDEVNRVLERDLNMDVFESVDGWLRDPYADGDEGSP